MLSGPADLLGFRSLSSFFIPFSVILISSITGKSSSDYGILAGMDNTFSAYFVTSSEDRLKLLVQKFCFIKWV